MHAVAVCLEMVGEQSASRRLQACSDRQSFMLSRRLWAQCCDILYLTGSGSARTRNSLGLTRPQPRASGEGAVESSVGQSVIPSACALAADSISPSPEPQEGRDRQAISGYASGYTSKSGQSFQEAH
ncbi:uncharacterized protein LOC110431229 isoform X2 [Sorghum bicolor]|uniref:uncharacterized protein LOC110431229 isoform X2 n=1 Tax=Sorghum bicolor TaxID=4558 RepID=UPI000B426503|nr:uncharacterized protein LOC110431229 isoform X2 [Sorghum bicolor]XP_021305699.1 uncharacterized protein LOC110431229 isoform X2 [Sorghum bicolor]XP_021305700.1 uncharacterized protein LOC110431229 isoform X2 [Sorghum bicolor]XP_021305702.1 uncharacterized protein LOC110431229 isoform X2 [Sorghum bicolor]|eukprot:XP_021305698.1 uncharacterized protein LOC110431229 isoform X2 [Sorghum bicolor]